jgi:putative PIN family toxin of toxin-antitoxin system
MKVVLDTNVLIDGFKDEYSYEKRIIDAVTAGEIEAFANKQTLRENRFISSRIQDPEYQKLLNDFFTQISDVPNPRRVHIVRDREDNKILESAVEARADFLVSSDKALLEIEKYKGVKIVTPIEFWAKYKDEGMDLWKQWTNFISNQ